MPKLWPYLQDYERKTDDMISALRNTVQELDALKRKFRAVERLTRYIDKFPRHTRDNPFDQFFAKSIKMWELPIELRNEFRDLFQDDFEYHSTFDDFFNAAFGALNTDLHERCHVQVFGRGSGWVGIEEHYLLWNQDLDNIAEEHSSLLDQFNCETGSDVEWSIDFFCETLSALKEVALTLYRFDKAHKQFVNMWTTYLSKRKAARTCPECGVVCDVPDAHLVQTDVDNFEYMCDDIGIEEF